MCYLGGFESAQQFGESGDGFRVRALTRNGVGGDDQCSRGEVVVEQFRGRPIEGPIPVDFGAGFARPVIGLGGAGGGDRDGGAATAQPSAPMISMTALTTIRPILPTLTIVSRSTLPKFTPVTKHTAEFDATSGNASLYVSFARSGGLLRSVPNELVPPRPPLPAA